MCWKADENQPFLRLLHYIEKNNIYVKIVIEKVNKS